MSGFSPSPEAIRSYITGLANTWAATQTFQHVLFAADNTYDIGESGGSRPRNVYAAGLFRVDQNGRYDIDQKILMSSSAAGMLTLESWATGDFGRLMFGGTSASFPSLKRSGAALHVRLADDSAFADMAMGATLQITNSNSNVQLVSYHNGGGCFHVSNFFGVDQGLLGILVPSNWFLGFTDINNTVAGAGSDVRLYKDAADTLALRRSTNAQILRGYRTFTDASNYERWALQSGASYFELAAETAGTGTDDIDLRVTPAGNGRVDFRNADDAAAAQTGTLTNAPTAGNPTFWITIKVNGTALAIPAWALP